MISYLDLEKTLRLPGLLPRSLRRCSAAPLTLLTHRKLVFNSRTPIKVIARAPYAFVAGLLYVLSASLAWQYDGKYLLHGPWCSFLPVGASLTTASLLYLLRSPSRALAAQKTAWTLGALLLWVVAASGRSVVADDSDSPVRFLRQWGRQGSKPGEFHFPIGIAVNRADEVFVTDHYNNRVQKFDAAGELLSCFETLPNPGGIGVDREGNLYISHFPTAAGKETTPDRISVLSPDGKRIREWGSSGTGDGELNWPGGIAIGRNGRVYVADQTNHRVQMFDRRGRFLGKWGKYGTRPGQFGGKALENSRVGGPQFIALDAAGAVYTTEASVGRVQKFTADGESLLAWGDNEDKPGSFGGKFRGTSLQGPIAICFDHQGHVWISTAGGRVQQFTAEGDFLRSAGRGPGSRPGEFLAPHGVAIDSRNRLYVVDSYNHRIQQFDVGE